MRRPSDKRLADWIDNDIDRVERHLERHPEDVPRAEALSQLDPALRQAMADELAVPEDIVERTRREMRDDVRWRDSVSALADLFALPYHVGRAVIGLPEDQGSGSSVPDDVPDPAGPQTSEESP